ncbi:hypothetical protein GCM10009092_10950 [Bowmanella denitrificans]|uniref:Hemerythrin-like domain-containing protein n=1 Tax=Bowmanella denitrificans TaxID=366582 RepID=A0ABP3GQ08_9ALTE|nr:hemerythrin domain-containing protein [Bowmanella denitrificans]
MQKILSQLFNTNLHALELLFIAYRRLKKDDPVLSRQLFDKFKTGMLQHIEQEEQSLLPELCQVTGDAELIRKARREHQQLRQQLDWIENLLDKRIDSQEDDRSLELMLSDHIENDEFGLYPCCDKLLNTDAVTRVLMELYP